MRPDNAQVAACRAWWADYVGVCRNFGFIAMAWCAAGPGGFGDREGWGTLHGGRGHGGSAGHA